MDLRLALPKYPRDVQCAKKVLSDSVGLVDFPVMLVNSVSLLPDGQVEFLGEIFEEIQITEVLQEMDY